MSDQEVRTQLVRMLTVAQAHMSFEEAVADFPEAALNMRPPNCDYSFWHLIEHLRLCQKDIVDYIEAEDYHWPEFPVDYWPERSTRADRAGWDRSVAAFIADRRRLVEIIEDPARDLYAPLPNSGSYQHNILREIHIIASHNAYHIGELGVLRAVMGLWPPDHV